MYMTQMWLFFHQLLTDRIQDPNERARIEIQIMERLNRFSRSLTPQGSPKIARDTIALPQCRQVHKRMKVSNKITLTGLKKTPFSWP